MDMRKPRSLSCSGVMDVHGCINEGRNSFATVLLVSISLDLLADRYLASGKSCGGHSGTAGKAVRNGKQLTTSQQRERLDDASESATKTKNVVRVLFCYVTPLKPLSRIARLHCLCLSDECRRG
jgi:hypothetical protein